MNIVLELRQKKTKQSYSAAWKMNSKIFFDTLSHVVFHNNTRWEGRLSLRLKIARFFSLLPHTKSQIDPSQRHTFIALLLHQHILSWLSVKACCNLSHNPLPLLHDKNNMISSLFFFMLKLNMSNWANCSICLWIHEASLVHKIRQQTDYRDRHDKKTLDWLMPTFSKKQSDWRVIR